MLIDVPGLGIAQPCEMDAVCLASPAHAGAASRCSCCKWSPSEPGEGRDYFRTRGREGFARRDQVQVEERKKKNAAKRAAKLGRDKGRKILGKRAASAEKQTERNIIKATRNSGRSNRDGDHIAAGGITLDTKLQTGNLHPVVNMAELAKVRMDAHRIGHPIGGLILRNRLGVGVVVLAEEDWAQILALVSRE